MELTSNTCNLNRVPSFLLPIFEICDYIIKALYQQAASDKVEGHSRNDSPWVKVYYAYQGYCKGAERDYARQRPLDNCKHLFHILLPSKQFSNILEVFA